MCLASFVLVVLAWFGLGLGREYVLLLCHMCVTCACDVCDVAYSTCLKNMNVNVNMTMNMNINATLLSKELVYSACFEGKRRMTS